MKNIYCPCQSISFDNGKTWEKFQWTGYYHYGELPQESTFIVNDFNTAIRLVEEGKIKICRMDWGLFGKRLVWGLWDDYAITKLNFLPFVIKDGYQLKNEEMTMDRLFKVLPCEEYIEFLHDKNLSVYPYIIK